MLFSSFFSGGCFFHSLFHYCFRNFDFLLRYGAFGQVGDVYTLVTQHLVVQSQAPLKLGDKSTLSIKTEIVITTSGRFFDGVGQFSDTPVIHP